MGREDGKMVALRQLVAEGLTPPVLIFVQSKESHSHPQQTPCLRLFRRCCHRHFSCLMPLSQERAVELFHALVYDGLHVDVMHADRSQASHSPNAPSCVRRPPRSPAAQAQRDGVIEQFRRGKVSGCGAESEIEMAIAGLLGTCRALRCGCSLRPN